VRVVIATVCFRVFHADSLMILLSVFANRFFDMTRLVEENVGAIATWIGRLVYEYLFRAVLLATSQCATCAVTLLRALYR
jgi:hypothetical protein